MIAYLSGTVLDAQADNIILLVGAIGYKVSLPHNSVLTGSVLNLYTHTHQNQDSAPQLWGFYKIEELTLFELLLQVSGVGPKTAALLVHDLGITKVVEAITTATPSGLKVPGIGAKTAERMIIDLRDKLVAFSGYVSSGGISKNQHYDSIISTLENLGYTHKEADQMYVAAKIPTDSTLSEAIKQTLNSNK